MTLESAIEFDEEHESGEMAEMNQYLNGEPIGPNEVDA
jgi:hypothetical protein